MEHDNDHVQHTERQCPLAVGQVVNANFQRVLESGLTNSLHDVSHNLWIQYHWTDLSAMGDTIMWWQLMGSCEVRMVVQFW